MPVPERCVAILCGALAAVLSGAPEVAPPALPSLEWDPASLVLVREGGNYARMVRLQNRDILCSYDRGGKVYVSRSADGGRTWGEEALVCASAWGIATNADLLQLASGGVLLAWNERPTDGTHPFAIQACRSRDDGRTWSAPVLVYEADTRFENGCWEPAAIQLPSGEVQLFFANENPYRQSAEQEIALVRSLDQGTSWSAPVRVSFRAGHRDGMPSPLLLRHGRGIAVAIEDDGLDGAFKPVIVSSSLADTWRECVDGTSPRRWGALRTPLASAVYAGAPCLRQLSGGETVLSYHCASGRREPEMQVVLGDDEARGFAAPSVPFQSHGVKPTFLGRVRGVFKPFTDRH